MSSQERKLLDFLLEQVPVVVWTTDTQLHFTSSEGRALEELGLQPGQVVGVSLYDYFHNPDPEFPPIAHHRAALAGKATSWEQQWDQRIFQCYTGPLENRGRVIGVVGIALDISERESARRALRAMTVRVTEVEELERQRLARELHDRVGQSLTALSLNLLVATNRLDPLAAENVRSLLADCARLVEEVSQTVRGIMADLRPPVLDDFGLVTALRWYGDRFSNLTGIHFELTGTELVPRLDAATESNLLLIAREALTNISRHSQAGGARIEVGDLGEIVRLAIIDDGQGFDPDTQQLDRTAGWGLMTMRERAAGLGGSLAVESRTGGPTRIVAEVPRSAWSRASS
ncbi:MAG: PAS domain-containing protein [Armatimonadetes bacterium]|nr:PAS domain-containing protein [Armatimonadota bacterium]